MMKAHVRSFDGACSGWSRRIRVIAVAAAAALFACATSAWGGDNTVGACCIAQQGVLDCQLLTESDCLAAGGRFLGANVECSPGVCTGEATGACCLPNGTDCVSTTATKCSDLGGAYQGDGTSCTPGTPCSDEPIGACCLQDDDLGTHCFIGTESDCDNVLGEFFAGETCESIGCVPPDPDPTGACCLDPQNGLPRCSDLTEAECASLGGMYQGDGTTCAGFTCMPGDATNDGAVNVADLFMVLNQWGPCDGEPADCHGDVNRSGAVDVQDLFVVLQHWGS